MPLHQVKFLQLCWRNTRTLPALDQENPNGAHSESDELSISTNCEPSGVEFFYSGKDVVGWPVRHESKLHVIMIRHVDWG